MQELLQEIENTLRRIIREEIRSALQPQEVPIEAAEKPSDRLLNTKDAVAYCRISEVTLWRIRKNGEIGFFRAGNRLLYSVEKHLIPYLKSHERKVQ